MMPAVVAAWHAIVESGDPARLPDLIAEDAVFRSPAIHAPQEGRALVVAYLEAALAVLGPTLRYGRQWYADDSAVLEFFAELDGFSVHGVDILQWNADGRLMDFTVMVRPRRGLEQLITHMRERLAGSQ